MEASFLFVDVAGFTALTEAHGDEAAADLIGRFQSLIRDAAKEEAEVVDSVGDGAFLAAPDAAAALRVAARLWSAVDAEPAFPAIRGGLHHGEAIRRGDRFFGMSVNLAARVAAQARGGELLATATAASAAAAEGRRITSLGPLRLRNLSEPVELFSVELRTMDSSTVLDPVCRMKVDPRDAAGQLWFAGQRYWFCSLECAGRFSAAPERYVESGSAS
jgi:class 3 adenylate cyclase/YHS domain-containing protein